MIVFDLSCSRGHVFEAWFGSSADYQDQKDRHLLSCPLCGDGTIEKAVMAPHVGRKSNQKGDRQTALAAAPAKEMTKLLAKMQRHVEENFDYVGDKFADEARRIHYGETDVRGIYGEATAAETKDLIDEGVDIVPMPMPAKPRKTDA